MISAFIFTEYQGEVAGLSRILFASAAHDGTTGSYPLSIVVGKKNRENPDKFGISTLTALVSGIPEHG